MSLLTEGSPGGQNVALQVGLEQLSNKQTLTFSKYQRQVVSQDGFVYWVNTGQTMQAVGSLHYATSQDQNEDETLGVNSIIFTSEVPIEAFNAINEGVLWIAQWPVPSGATIQFAFSRQGPYYQQADLWHYSGFAVYPALSSQILQSASDIPTGPIVNDSLPIWLSLPTELASTIESQAPVIPVYASFLVPENIVPPYAVAHIVSTKALGAFPIDTWPAPSAGTNLYDVADSQLMADDVRLTFYGLNNQQSRQYLNALIAYSLDSDTFGFMNTPSFQDERRTQSEITAIAMKKTLHIRASYYQQAADVLARRLILSASIGSITV